MRRTLTAIVFLAAALAAWSLLPSRAEAGWCWDLKPMRPLGCYNGYIVCSCDDPYDMDTCRWMWICPSP